RPSIDAACSNIKAGKISNAEFICGDILNMSWTYPQPDLIVSNSALHYIPGDLRIILKRLYEILKPGGFIIATIEKKDLNIFRSFQKFNLLFMPKVIRKNFHYLMRMIYIMRSLLFNNKGLTENESESLKGKSRYIAIPTVQDKTKEELLNDFNDAGFEKIEIEMMPPLNKLSIPHFFIMAAKKA
ncbi:MAG: class I SAM-dependent methyltransferase, partial [Nitrospirae bacterium]|nr:class I SAM-dependent methyltransferase [Nitrospirota bacterium]